MLLCDDAESQHDHPNRWNVSGLLHALTFASDTTFPTNHPLLTILLHLTGGRGSGRVSIVGVHADSEQVVFGTPQRTIQFPNDPLAVYGLVFRILDVPIPERGLYYIQFRYDDEVIFQQPLLIR
jgi:hypothetical protein